METQEKQEQKNQQEIQPVNMLLASKEYHCKYCLANINHSQRVFIDGYQCCCGCLAKHYGEHQTKSYYILNNLSQIYRQDSIKLTIEEQLLFWEGMEKFGVHSYEAIIYHMQLKRTQEDLIQYQTTISTNYQSDKEMITPLRKRQEQEQQSEQMMVAQQKSQNKTKYDQKDYKQEIMGKSSCSYRQKQEKCKNLEILNYNFNRKQFEITPTNIYEILLSQYYNQDQNQDQTELLQLLANRYWQQKNRLNNINQFLLQSDFLILDRKSKQVSHLVSAKLSQKQSSSLKQVEKEMQILLQQTHQLLEMQTQIKQFNRVNNSKIQSSSQNSQELI